MDTDNEQSHDVKILSLDRRARGADKMDRIERYWEGIRGKRLVPSRCEIDPRGLDGVLGHAFILERIAGGLARFRIAGSHLTDITGLELRQMPLSALFLPGSREILSDALQAVFDEPAVVRLDIASPSGFGRGALVGELILLPLRSDLGDVDRVLGGLVFEGKIGRTPRRIEVVSQTRKSLTGYAGPAHASALEQHPVSIPGTILKTFERPRKVPSAGQGSSHLKLVVSND